MDQPVDRGALGLLMESADDRGRQRLAHAVDREEFFPIGALPDLGAGHCGLERGPRQVMVGQKRCARLADMADAEGENHPGERDPPLVVNRLEEIERGFLSPTFSVLELLQTTAKARAQGEDIGGFPDPPVAIEGLDLFRAKPLDVEGRTRDEMLELLDRLRRADQPPRAAAHRIARLADRIRATFRAFVRENIRLCRLFAAR